MEYRKLLTKKTKHTRSGRGREANRDDDKMKIHNKTNKTTALSICGLRAGAGKMGWGVIEFSGVA